MTGVETRTSGIKSDHSTNWATTTSHNIVPFIMVKAKDCSLLANYIVHFVTILYHHSFIYLDQR